MRYWFSSLDSLLMVAMKYLPDFASCSATASTSRWGCDRENTVLEHFTGKGTGTVEDGAIEIFVEADLAPLQRGNQHLVAVQELGLVEFELLERALPLGAVPGIGEQHAAYVPKDGAD